MRAFAKGRDIMAHDARIARRRRRRAYYRPEVIMAEEKKGTHGGPRTPGPGKKLGRSRREEPKSKPIWCGQITDEQRQTIMESLAPEERLEALLNYKKMKSRLAEILEYDLDITEECRICDHKAPDHDDACVVTSIRKIIEEY